LKHYTSDTNDPKLSFIVKLDGNVAREEMQRHELYRVRTLAGRAITELSTAVTWV